MYFQVEGSRRSIFEESKVWISRRVKFLSNVVVVGNGGKAPIQTDMN
jgi:hypothetical protein